MGFSISLKDKTEENVDRQSKIPEGWYKAVLDDVVNDESKGTCTLTFAIANGVYTGMTATDRLFDPEMEQDDAKRQRKIDKIATAATRLGLLKKEDLGKEDFVPVFEDAIGTEVVIEIEHSKMQNGGMWAQVKWLGFYPLDHYDVPDNVREALQLPPAREAPKGATGVKTAPKSGKGAKPAAKPAARQNPASEDLAANL